MDSLEVDTGVLQVELARIKEEEDDDGESMSSLTAGAEGSLSHEVHTLSNSDGLVGDDNDTLPSAISNSGEDDDAGVSVDPSAEGSVVSVMDDGSVSNSSAMEAVAAIGNAIPVTSEQVIGLLHVLQTGEAEGVGEGTQGQQVSIAMTLSEGSMLPSGQTIQAITMPDGSTAYLHPPKDGNFLAGQGLTLVDGRTAIVQGLGSDKDASNDSTKLFDGQSIQFEDGTTALLQAGKSVGESFRAVTLDDGTTAFITNANHPDALFGDAASLDGTTLSLDQLTSQGVLNGNSGRLTTEKALAIGEKAYRCGYEGCGRLYTTLHHLKVHERSHTGDRPFKCDFQDCNKAFATGYGLKSHTRVHTGEKPYPCLEDNCDKAFKTSGDLQKHVRTHTGERPFRCPFEGCDRSFTTSNIRKVHIRTHTGERPYVCQMEGCNRAFASATNYKNHIRIHTGEKPYVCTVAGCGKRFTEYSSLYKHHVVHTHSKPYVCNICSKTYRQTSTLAMHKRTSHGVEVTTDCEVQLFAEQQEGEASSQERPNKRRKVEFTMSNAEGNGNTEEGDGTLVINTTDVQQVNQVATAMMSTGEGESQGLQMLALPPATLQQLSQTAGITSISVGDQGQQVLVVADPSQLEALQQLAQQHSFEETAGLEQAVEAAADSDAVDAITVATGDSAVADGTMVMFQTE